MRARITPTIVICTVAAGIAAASLALPASPPGGRPAPAQPSIAAGASSRTDRTATIEIVDFAFDGELTVAPGQVISITNRDGAPHTLSAVDGSFDTGVLDPGAATELIAPGTPGTYAFICQIHPSMTAELTVAP